MTIDLKLLDIKIKGAKEEVADSLLETFQKVAIQVDQAVVLATPKDTGRAASNWLPSLNIPVTEARDFANDATISSTLMEAGSVVAKAKLGDVIYFSNNLPYIGRLNDGSSMRASAGFVQKAALAAQVSLKGII
jgi:hypothetical protein